MKKNTNKYNKLRLVCICLVVCLVVIFFSCKTNIVSYDYGELVYIDLDFEDSNHSPWIASYTETTYDGEPHFKISNDTPSNGGNYSGRFYIGADGDYWLSPDTGRETARSEIKLKSTAQEGKEIYYSWYFKIDNNYVESDGFQIIGQFHDQPDPAIGQSWNTYPAHSPPLSYNYINGEFIIAVYSFEINHVSYIAAMPIEKGEWHHIKSRIYWSTTDNGFMEFWLDGNKIEESGVSRYTARNCFNKAGNYLNIGLYRSNDIDSLGMVYFDNIKSGPTYQSVE
ncbi:MAG: polysaccharide lyase [Spirochaetales bacterium]|uniref:Polysaccharide lyase n=1 Tax=Candidatus Thalassospirochaeta sargassi TaxID=3119039 RepID=A0AAJ1ID33_9SPIO|nr:polysaccharide lyase [Spirochaetales bacterium]